MPRRRPLVTRPGRAPTRGDAKGLRDARVPLARLGVPRGVPHATSLGPPDGFPLVAPWSSRPARRRSPECSALGMPTRFRRPGKGRPAAPECERLDPDEALYRTDARLTGGVVAGDITVTTGRHSGTRKGTIGHGLEVGFDGRPRDEPPAAGRRPEHHLSDNRVRRGRGHGRARRLPQARRRLQLTQGESPVVHVEAPAGSVLVFAETLIHTAVPITGETKRYALIYHFSQPWIASWPGYEVPQAFADGVDNEAVRSLLVPAGRDEREAQYFEPRL